MIKKIVFIACLFIFVQLQAQLKLTESNAIGYPLKKDPRYQAFQVDGSDIFAMRYNENSVDNYNFLVLDKNNNLSVTGPIIYNKGIFTNSTYINSLHQVGNSLVALMENANKSEGKNNLSIKPLSTSGVLGNTLKDLDFIPYTKMTQPGDWLSCTTPDKQHLAIIALFPPEKGVPQKAKYYFLDAAFNVLSSNEFTIGSGKKRYYFKFAASDAGDMYLINEESEKGYIFLWFTANQQQKTFSEFTVALKDPLKISNYAYGVSPTGSFVVAGYSKEKQGFISNGDMRNNGFWVYNTDKPSEIAHHLFEKNIANVEARHITFNGNKLFFGGEQVWKTQEPRPVGYTGFDENFNYKYENVVITGYDMEANTKFDLQLNRKFSARNFTVDLSAAAAMVNGKFVLLYNDELAKYVQGASSYYKLPVTVSITGEGLMEPPYHYEKEMKTYSSYTVLPFFYSISNNQITVLANSGIQVKAIRMK